MLLTSKRSVDIAFKAVKKRNHPMIQKNTNKTKDVMGLPLMRTLMIFMNLIRKKGGIKRLQVYRT